MAIICDEHMAPALETLCIRWGIREDVAGATFLAFGSAAPEIVINCVTTIKSSVKYIIYNYYIYLYRYFVDKCWDIIYVCILL